MHTFLTPLKLGTLAQDSCKLLPFTRDIMHNGTILEPILAMDVEMEQICMLFVP